jgi:large subunit ribosomal protein L19
MDLLREFEKEQTKLIDRPLLKAGDIVRVETKIQEGEKSRLQTFEGTVLGVRGSGPSASFTVRRDASGFGVERIFPLYSPLIATIEIVKRQKVRRAKLNYLRQAGRRRVKEDELSMQRHLKEESDKKRLAAESAKRAEDEAAKAQAEEKVASETSSPA